MNHRNTDRPRITNKVTRGLNNLLPAISILLEHPTTPELQELTPKELDDARTAYNYLCDLTNWHHPKPETPENETPNP